MASLRDEIGDRLRALVGNGERGAVDLTRPPGDEGLFGADAAARAVHGDFTAMMIGGTAALLMQMLHPLALAGVWDHSGFRRDMAGRLKRTAQFIAGTTYGSTATAEAMIARVRRIHERVEGTLPDGTPYRASDPALLTWVHVAEVRCFLAAHRRYRDPAMPAARQERYLREMAGLARRLGARDVPETRAGVEAYLTAMRPALLVDERTREVAAALLSQPGVAGMTMARDMVMNAATDLLPPWAARMHGIEPAPLARPAIRLGAHGAAAVMRWALAPRRAAAAG